MIPTVKFTAVSIGTSIKSEQMGYYCYQAILSVSIGSDFVPKLDYIWDELIKSSKWVRMSYFFMSHAHLYRLLSIGQYVQYAQI